MSVTLMLGIACLGMLVMVATVIVGALLLIRLRVITPSPGREEPLEQSSHGLDRSHEVSE
ncbi:MAG: hypothetical protein PVJ85_09675 [Anaerolineae bacterium]